jgi:TonB-linked SusC/RagA family outer membrane protein
MKTMLLFTVCLLLFTKAGYAQEETALPGLSGEQLEEIPAANITQALQGWLAGVEVMQTSSKPGANMQIRIRGTRSLSGNNAPFVVLDGIPFTGSLADINPVDIKNINVLKDAAATAIYGSRGANGVLLLTTYRGVQGSKAKISYHSYTGVKTLFAPYPMMEGPEYVALRKAVGLNLYTIDEADNINTNWQDLFYRNGLTTNHNISITGGMAKGGYHFGAGYTRDEALLPTQNFNRFSLQGSIDQEIGKYFRFGISTTNSHVATNGNQIDLYNVLNKSPIINPYHDDGSTKRTVQGLFGGNMFVWTRDVLEGLGDEYISPSKGFGTYNSFYGELKIPGVEGLKYRLNAGLNFYKDNSGYYQGEGIGSSNPTNPSYTTVNNTDITTWVVENLLSYDRIFAGKHQLNVTALFSTEQTSYNNASLKVRNIPRSAFQFHDIERLMSEFGGAAFERISLYSSLRSWGGSAMYAYANRYILSVSVRTDGSSRFASAHRWNTYPAISAGWNINEEPFMQNASFINRLKLHASYGKTSTETSTNMLNYDPSTIVSSDLTPEDSETWSFAVDFSLLKNRLTGTIEYYVQNTKNILAYMTLRPSASHTGSIYIENAGQTQNKGAEFSLNGVILNNLNGWTWEAGMNIYANRNKIVALAPGVESDDENWWFTGYPIDVIYDYEKIGLWQEGDPYLQVLEPAGNVGMIKVKYTGDYNANGTPVRAINATDRQVQSTDPTFQGGFNTRVSYKGFELSMTGAFKNGGILISTIHGSANYLNMLDGRHGQVKVDYWTEDNTDAKYPKPGGLESNYNPVYGSTLALFDASYLKMRTITLGYNFTQKWMKNAGIDRLRLYFTVQNPFVLFSPYHSETGMDPETNSYGNENTVLIAYPARLLTIGVNSPATRNYILGINLTL